MTKTLYRVYLSIERLNPIDQTSQELGQKLECATFKTFEEACDFVHELKENHCACASGESVLLGEMTAPEIFTAGD